MRMFDSFVTHIIISFLSCIVSAVNILLIYVIWKHSPKSMGKFRYWMLKMAITDFLFSTAIAWLFLPNLLFPLPAATVAGLLKFLGKGVGPFAFAGTCIAAAMTILSVNDCCFYRIFVFYKIDKWIDRAESLTFAIGHTLLDIFLVSSFVTFMLYISTATPEVSLATRHKFGLKYFRDYCIQHGRQLLYDNIPPDSPIIAFNLDHLPTQLSMFVIVFFLVACAIFHSYANWIVYRKVMESRNSMSQTTFDMQKTLTYILLTQAVMPAISINIPISVYAIALIFEVDSILNSIVVEWIVVLIVGGYPLFNSIFCLYCMKPYRTFTKRLFKKILVCIPWSAEVEVVPEASASSGNNPVVSVNAHG